MTLVLIYIINHYKWSFSPFRLCRCKWKNKKNKGGIIKISPRWTFKPEQISCWYRAKITFSRFFPLCLPANIWLIVCLSAGLGLRVLLDSEPSSAFWRLVKELGQWHWFFRQWKKFCRSQYTHFMRGISKDRPNPSLMFIPHLKSPEISNKIYVFVPLVKQWYSWREVQRACTDLLVPLCCSQQLWGWPLGFLQSTPENQSLHWLNAHSYLSSMV